MKKALICTYSRSYNFGASLQSYSLQRFVRQLGWECKVVDIRSEEQINNKISYRTDLKGMPLNLFTFLNRKKLAVGRARFNAYHYDVADRERLPCKNNEPDFAPLENDPLDVDVYISGSDQVFSPSLMSQLYFLDFNTAGAKCISYAASVGVSEIPEEKKALFAERLKKFDAISVREEQACLAVQPLTEKKIQVHADPVFLTPKDIWETEETAYKPLEGKKYIFAYFLYRPKGMNAYLKELSRKTGLPVVLVDTSAFRNIYHDHLVLDAGPGEFLWLLHHAQMVATSSFHGTALSLIYEKDFVVFNNPATPARIAHVLKTFGAEDHWLKDTATVNPEAFKLKDAEKETIRSAIAEQTQRAKEYLISNMEG